MKDQDVTLDEHVMYLRMGEQALAQSNQAADPAIRAQFLDTATHWLNVAHDMEQFCAGPHVAPRRFGAKPFDGTRALDRRKDFELRQMIDEYRGMAADARKTAEGARGRTQADLLAIAKSWEALADELAGRRL